MEKYQKLSIFACLFKKTLSGAASSRSANSCWSRKASAAASPCDVDWDSPSQGSGQTACILIDTGKYL